MVDQTVLDQTSLMLLAFPVHLFVAHPSPDVAEAAVIGRTADDLVDLGQTRDDLGTRFGQIEVDHHHHYIATGSTQQSHGPLFATGRTSVATKTGIAEDLDLMIEISIVETAHHVQIYATMI